MTHTRRMTCRKASAYSWMEGRKVTVEFNEQAGILNFHPDGQSWSPQGTHATEPVAVQSTELEPGVGW